MSGRPSAFQQTTPSFFATGIAGAFGVWQGLTILGADQARFAGPGYALTRDTITVWGIVVLVGGLATLAGTFARWFWVKVAGLFAVSVWLILFGLGAFGAVAASPSAGPTGGPTYVCFGLIVMCLTVYRRGPR